MRIGRLHSAPHVSDQKLAKLLVSRAKEIRSADLSRAIFFGELAIALEPSASVLKWLAGMTYDAGMIDRPSDLIHRAIKAGEPRTGAFEARARTVRGLKRLRMRGVEVPPRSSEIPYERRMDAILYVAASSLPHHISGYTTRTHNLTRAIHESGWDVTVATRVGYPWDRTDSRDKDLASQPFCLDGVKYQRLRGPPSNSTAFDQYFDAARMRIMTAATLGKVGIVHAASNYVNGLPALAAARALGLPFVYEVRGLWEFTNAAKSFAGEAGERFELMRDLEGLTAREADVVLVLTEGLRGEMRERGVRDDRIHLTPNCVDIDMFQPRARNEVLAKRLGLGDRFVIGFLGSLVPYEGLEDLVTAASAAIGRGVDVALLIVGDGASASSIRERAAELGVGDRLVMPGRVPPEEVPDLYSLIDVAAFPRVPATVTELVSPLKPLEAMAMEKPVIVSSVAALAEMVIDGETGRIFAKGDIGSLTNAIVEFSENREFAAQIGKNGRRYVVTSRTWMVSAHTISGVYSSLLSTD